MTTEQLIWNGEGYAVADAWNSVSPEWPVQGEDSRWHHPAFAGQRVAFSGPRLDLGFLATEIDPAGVPVDEDGESDYSGLAVLPDGRVFRPL